MENETPRSRKERRFERQFDALARMAPWLRGPINLLRSDRLRIVRLPLAIVLIAGGFLWFLPLLGIWMMPAGLLLLAVDLPFLRGPISAFLIRARRRVGIWIAWARGRSAP